MTPDPTEQAVERAARIIDPEGWRVREYNLRCEADRLAWNTMEGFRQAPGFRQAADEAVADSLAKAREIVLPLLGRDFASRNPPCADAQERSPDAPSSDGWEPISSAPEVPGTYINVRSVTMYRYLGYKPDGVRQMKKPGRWQRSNGYGWDNAPLPAHAEWSSNYAPPSRSEGGE